MRNSTIQNHIKMERTPFTESIDHSVILELASPHHQKVPCRFFRPLRHTGFNVCLFVQFESPDNLLSKDTRDIYQVYWESVSDDRFKPDANQDRAKVRVKAISTCVASSETVQNWIEGDKIIQDKYYDEEDAYVCLDEEKDSTE